MLYIYWCYKTWEHLRVSSWKWEGRTLVQFKGSRVPLLGNVYVNKPCMLCVKHVYENNWVCYWENTLITMQALPEFHLFLWIPVIKYKYSKDISLRSPDELSAWHFFISSQPICCPLVLMLWKRAFEYLGVYNLPLLLNLFSNLSYKMRYWIQNQSYLDGSMNINHSL